MKYFAYIVAFIICSNLFAQSDFKDTTWFDRNWTVCEKPGAMFFRVYKKTEKGYLVHDKYLNGKIQMIAEASQLKPELVSEGYTEYFDEKGNRTGKGYYVNDKKEGIWVDYYEDDSSVTKFKDGVTVEVVRRSPKEPIYTITEKMAEFPGGISEMSKFIQHNLRYPISAREGNIGGKVFLKFVVTEEGELNNVEVIKSSGNGEIDFEAVRVVKSMPGWKPAEMTGKTVKCYFNLPLTFKMTDEPYFIFNVSNKNSDYEKAIVHINNKNLAKAQELLNENDPDQLYLLAVIDYMNKDKKKACKKFTKYIEITQDKSGQKAKIASGYLEKSC